VQEFSLNNLVLEHSQWTFSRHLSSMAESFILEFSARHVRYFPSSSTLGTKLRMLSVSLFSENYKINPNVNTIKLTSRLAFYKKCKIPFSQKELDSKCQQQRSALDRSCFQYCLIPFFTFYLTWIAFNCHCWDI
jgi:hypothetical protein